MTRVKNIGGGPGDEDPRPLPRLLSEAKGKVMKKLATKKCKYPDADIERATAVATIADRAEKGGAQSGGHCRSAFTSSDGHYPGG